MHHPSPHIFRRIRIGMGMLVTAAVFATVTTAIFSPPALATSCGDAETSIISCEAAKSGTPEANDSANNPVVAVLTFVMQVLTGAVGIAAVGALIYAGILYAAAGGDSSQVQKSKTLIKDTVIGIVCYAGMILILNFVIPGGVFGQQSTTGGGTAPAPSTGTPGDGGGGGPTDPNAGKKSTTLTIASWNVLYNNGASDIKSGAKKIGSSGADLIGFQELNFPSNRNAVKDGLVNCSGCDFSGYFPGSSSASGWNAPSTVSLVWRKELFSKLDQGQIHVSDADGPANTGDKWITWVKLKDKKTGVTFYFATTHFVAKVRQLSSNSQIKQNYYNHITKLASFVSGKKQPVFIAGDFNMAYNYDKANDHTYKGHSYSPKRVLKKYDLYSNWEYAKKSTMAIDYIWAPKRTDVQYVSMKRWSSAMGSDHKPVEMTVKIYEE